MKARSPNMDGREADRIAALLERFPLPLVRRMTALSYEHLARIAKVRFQ